MSSPPDIHPPPQAGLSPREDAAASAEPPRAGHGGRTGGSGATGSDGRVGSSGRTTRAVPHDGLRADAPPKASIWARSPERSTLWALRGMARLSLRIGRPLTRLSIYPITAYFMCFAPAARRASLDYLRRVLGHRASPLDGFRQVSTFAGTVHDRIFLINDRFDLFDIRIHGGEIMQALLAQRRGAFLIGAHLGSFEVLSAVGRQMAGMRASMLMYEENARKINATIEAINPKALLDIIPMGRVDSMLKVRQKLDDGEMVGLLADRTPADETTVELPFLGANAPFPVGPFRLAALMRRPVIFMTGIYSGGNRYDVHFETLADFSTVARADRDSAIEAAMRRYVALLEKHCRASPYNWFNFFPFWSEQSDNDLFCENL